MSAINAIFPDELMDAVPGSLAPAEIDALWTIFLKIGEHWQQKMVDPDHQRSQWMEFLHAHTTEAPSYSAEYRHGLQILKDLQQRDGPLVWTKLFQTVGPTPVATTGYTHFRKYVVEEFIKVWLTSGGFREFGAGNYNSYVSGSRFAIDPQYRLAV
jgi:hypothetical protein